MKLTCRQLVLAGTLLLVIAGTALAETYSYTCTRCGMIQQFNQKKIGIKCSKCGSSMYQDTPYGRIY